MGQASATQNLVVLSRVEPMHKLRLVELLKAQVCVLMCLCLHVPVCVCVCQHECVMSRVESMHKLRLVELH